MYSIRTRSGSVGREPPTSTVSRVSFGARNERSSVQSTSRFSRAASCDPKASSSSRPPPPSMSHSYHSDYSTKSSSLTNRYGSVGNLSSHSTSTYRSPYSSSYRTDSSYRKPEPASTYRGSELSSYRTYRASSTFTPRFEQRLSSREFSSSSLNKYRPDSTPSYSRSSYTPSLPSPSYSSRPRVDFRSKTPMSTETTGRTSRFDREYKSMSRFEKTEKTSKEEKSDDEVENTFQKLYNRYVKDVDLPETKKPPTEKKFVSHSEAEATSESESSSSEMETSFSETLRRRRDGAQSITPKGPSPSLVTPTASPLVKKKVLEEPKKKEEPVMSIVDEFRLKHSDVEMKPAVIEARVLKPAASAMANLLKMDKLAAKVVDAMQKKKVEAEIKPSPTIISTVKNQTVKKASESVKPSSDPILTFKAPETKTSSVNKESGQATPKGTTVKSTALKKPTEEAVKAGFFKPPSPIKSAPEMSKSSTTRRSASPVKRAIPTTIPVVSKSESPTVTSPAPTVTKPNGSVEEKKIPVSPVGASLTVPMITGSGKIVKTEPKNLLPPVQKARSASPRPKPALTIDTKKAEEASASMTILMPKGDEMSRSVSPSLLDSERTSAAERRKNRGNRTLEHMLKEVADKRDDKSSTDSPVTPRAPPLLLVTHASVPSTPKTTAKEEWGSGSGSYYGSDEFDDEEGWTEGEDEVEYDSDYEFCINETFRIPTKTNVYPPSMRGSPFVSDYESDCSASFLAQQKREDSRGRVDRLFAVPPPIFTCSVSYDGQESWDSESVHSCGDEDEEEMEEEADWRPTSSSLGAYRSPGPFESDEDLEGDVQVGFTLKLVDKAALKDSEESDSAEYYDDEDEEYSEEEYWEEEEYEEDEEYEEEDYEEEEEDEVSMISADESSPSPVLFTASIAEEQFDFDEAEESEMFETDFEMALSHPVDALDYTAAKHREVTYTKDLEMHTTIENADDMSPGEREAAAKAVAKKIKKDGTTETANKTQVPQMIAPVEEELALMETEMLELDSLEMVSPLDVDAETGTGSVSVVPTFVRPQTEKIQEEFTNRFATSKPSTDFAKKAVIQPTKLEKAQVKETKTTTAPSPPLSSVQSKESVEKTKETVPKVRSKEPRDNSIEIDAAPKETKKTEDKSAVRKSALNMSAEDAKRKAALDEEAAKQKARRFGTVGVLADKFKDKLEDPITYKRSSRLAPKDDEPKARRKYEIVKPVINDEFDKQMQEIRAQMKAGSSQFQSELKNLSKGISSTTEEAKKRELEDKHKQLLDKTSGVFEKADSEKKKWLDRRVGKDVVVEKEKKTVNESVEEPKKEPKRTIRKIKKDTGVEVLKEKGAENKTPEAPCVQAKDAPNPQNPPPIVPPVDRIKVDRTPVVNPADTLKKPATPKQEIVVDDSNFDLFQAATKVATTRKKWTPWDPSKAKITQAESGKKQESQVAAELSAKLNQHKEKPGELKAPKAEGAVATKIRNALGNTTNGQVVPENKPLKKYATRRKTQEIVNESVIQPKKKRKMTSRHGKFIGDPHDIDVLLGWAKENTFEQLEKLFSGVASRKTVENKKPVRRRNPTKVWISDLMDIDKIYKASEIRDISASVEAM